MHASLAIFQVHSLFIILLTVPHKSRRGRHGTYARVSNGVMGISVPCGGSIGVTSGEVCFSTNGSLAATPRPQPCVQPPLVRRRYVDLLSSRPAHPRRFRALAFVPCHRRWCSRDRPDSTAMSGPAEDYLQGFVSSDDARCSDEEMLTAFGKSRDPSSSRLPNSLVSPLRRQRSPSRLSHSPKAEASLYSLMGKRTDTSDTLALPVCSDG